MPLGLFVKAAARIECDDAQQLCLEAGRAAFPLEQLLGLRHILCDLSAAHEHEGQLCAGVAEKTGECDRIAAARPAVNSHKYVLEHDRSPFRVETRLGREARTGHP